MFTPNVSASYTAAASYSPVNTVQTPAKTAQSGSSSTAAVADPSANVEKSSVAVEKSATAVENAAAQKDTFQSKAETPSNLTEGVIYKPNAAMVSQLKAEQEAIQSRFLDMVRQTLSKQGKSVSAGDDIWKQIAQGDFSVDAQTKADAQSAISEDGYWGVKQTSERLLNFAKALTGGDPSRAEEMRSAFVKGYEAAAKAMGGTLPDIAAQTYDATMKLFDDWANESSAA